MSHLVLHPQTQQHIARICANPPHALLLTASDGMGKTAIAIHCIAAVLELTSDGVATSPHCKIIGPDPKTGSVSIDQIRLLQRFVKLRTTGTKQIRRAILIEHADTLTTEAQNALLKLLEEPPADTIIILTATGTNALLPTIQSRVQTLPITRPERVDIEEHFKSQHSVSKISQAYFLSGGMPGLMSALLENEEHPLLTSVQNAKQLLQEDSFTRLARLDQYAKQKTDALQLCNALQRMSQAALEQAAEKGAAAGIKRWHVIYKAAHLAQQQLLKNASTKLVMTQLLLQLSA